MVAEKRIFTYEEALESFPRVRELTAAAVARVDGLLQQLQSREELEARRAEIESAYERIVQEWIEEVTALGCEVKGLWLVDWDSGDGYYCWRHPEESLSHFHSYEDGFQGRVPIQ